MKSRHTKRGTMMNPIKLGLNGATIMHADIMHCLEVTANAGFSYYEPREPQLTMADSKAVVDLLKMLGLQWLPLNALGNVFEIDITKMEEFFTLAKEFGIDKIILVPGCKKVSYSNAVEKLKALVMLARDFSIQPLYELIGFTTHPFNSLLEAKQLAEESAIQLVLDTFHLAISKTSLETIVQIQPKLIGLIHLSDAEGKDLRHMKDENRVLPGRGVLPLVDILKALRDIGYDGPFSVEVFHPQYYKRPPLNVAKEAFETSLNLLSKAGWVG